MRFLGFIKSPLGSVTVFAVFAAVGGWLIHRTNARERAYAAQLTKVESSPPEPMRQSILRAGQPLKTPARVVPTGITTTPPVAAKEDIDPVRTRSGREARDSRPERPPPTPRALPISLVAMAVAEGPTLSKTYAPFGRLIPCETVITIESSKLDTPVVGLVIEDVWHNGELIIPARAEVHGRASLDRARERVAVSGKWVVVWRDASPLNGTELVINGIALDRSKDDTTGEFGLRDGSAGLLGDLVKSDDWQEIKLFASTFLAGAASGLQQLQNQGNRLRHDSGSTRLWPKRRASRCGGCAQRLCTPDPRGDCTRRLLCAGASREAVLSLCHRNDRRGTRHTRERRQRGTLEKAS